jgi:energy-coupling factor transport system ATP-binding protein
MATLSGGERQKVAICTALVNRPPLLLLDEPLEQLDPDAADDLLQRLHALSRAGTIVMMSSRSLDFMADYADQAVLLDDGKILAVAAPDPLTIAALLPSSCQNSAAVQKEALAPSSSADETKPQNMILTHQLTHLFSSGAGIKDINLAVHAGEIVAIMGPNGAGKSTLLKHFIGILQAQSGKVLILGEDASLVPVWKLAQKEGVLFQNPDDQIFNERIDREIAWSLKTARGCSWPQALEESQYNLQEFGLQEVKKLHPYSVSRSYRQLIALASVLISKPEIIILDEPGKSLDASNTERLMSILLSHFGTTAKSIIMVTHDPLLAWSYADRMVLLADGEILAQGRPQELFCDQALMRSAQISRHPFIRSLQDPRSYRPT